MVWPSYQEAACVMTDTKIVVIGGGTGSFTVLSALKHHTKHISAIVSMADDGGSTGVLRDELGVLPPGDVRQCLVALSDSPKVRDLFSYRFDEGTFQGHSFGNLLLTALEKVTGDFSEAVKTASEILRVNGKVIPVTLDDVRLHMDWKEEGVCLEGEGVIDTVEFAHDPRGAHLTLVPSASANQTALRAIQLADIIVIAPGDLYTSLGPLLVVDGIGEAIRSSRAMKVYVANLVTKRGHTDGFTISDHVSEIERFAGGRCIDYVLYNNARPSASALRQYDETGAYPTFADKNVVDGRGVGAPLLGKMATNDDADVLAQGRSLIRHDSEKVSQLIFKVHEAHLKLTQS